MFRIAALAVSATVLATAPAYAESIHVSTVGKSPESVKAEVYKAALQLCRSEAAGSALAYAVQSACVRATVRDALAQDPALVKLASR